MRREVLSLMGSGISLVLCCVNECGTGRDIFLAIVQINPGDISGWPRGGICRRFPEQRSSAP